MIARHGAVLGIAVGGLIVTALLGTSASPSTQHQVADSAWLAQLEPLRAHAAPLAEDCLGCGVALSALPTDAAVVAAEPAPAPVEPWGTMVIREGDTFFDLAAWFGISAWDLAAINGLSLEDYLVAGDTIVIPVPESQFLLPPEPEIYVAEIEAQPELAPVAYAPAPTVTPTPTPRPVYTGTADNVIAAICSLPWPCETMVRVATCESGLNPAAYNPAGFYGLFQLNVAVPGWDDPWINAQAAYNLKYAPAAAKGDGLTPWPHCRNY